MPYNPGGGNSGKTAFEEEQEQIQEITKTCLNKEQISVYPIPNSGTFTIKFETVTENIDLYIYSLDGKTVYQTQLNEKENTINNTNLAVGKYVMALYCPNGQYFDWTISVE
ncbi:MAG: T9SS type A sorting domain-containing protein [Chitinophagales bacterium]|nr:T9SS type A sorting domain-containing protein [Chitinophagales bacterium]